MTPTLSVDAFHATVTDVWVAPVERRLVGAVGGVVSPLGGGQADDEAVTDVVDERLPAASDALTPNVKLCPHGSPLIVAAVDDVVLVRLPSR